MKVTINSNVKDSVILTLKRQYKLFVNFKRKDTQRISLSNDKKII